MMRWYWLLLLKMLQGRFYFVNFNQVIWFSLVHSMSPSQWSWADSRIHDVNEIIIIIIIIINFVRTHVILTIVVVLNVVVVVVEMAGLTMYEL
mgnify:FL=1